MSCTTKNVLFLSTGNAVRSIFAEAIINQRGAGRVRGYSAGVNPTAAPHPAAVAFLVSLGHDPSTVATKSWRNFTRSDAPTMDFVFTLCRVRSPEILRNVPGQPAHADWYIPDPTARAVNHQSMQDALAHTYAALIDRVTLFLGTDFDRLAGGDVQARLDAIGRIDQDARLAAAQEHRTSDEKR